ncbi:MAG: response regulator, partial [Dehalococcoidia bacterium]
MLGGDVTVQSEEGKGSTFTLHLPATAPEQHDEEPPLAAASGTGALVLVVDDDPAARELLSRTLAKDGYRVATAATGAEALRLAREMRPRAITLDVLLPDEDGWAVLAALKADAELAHVPVLMLTILDDQQRGYALGASAFLTKPVDRERLLALLRQYGGEQAEPSILIVDDDGAMRELLRRALDGSGWRVTEAEDGREALELVAAERPALILLDLLMPELDGFAVVEALRERAEWRTIPVVVITARELSAADRQRLSGGVARILTKGAYSREELLNEVRERIAAHVSRLAGG